MTYEDYVIRVEKMNDKHGILKGKPIVICFTEKVDLDEFEKLLREKFNLLGIIERHGDVIVTYTVDMENGCPIELEVSENWCVVHVRLVPNSTIKECANTIERFLNNLRKCEIKFEICD